MAATEWITMTMRELDRFRVIQDVADGELKPWRAAERLRLTDGRTFADRVQGTRDQPRRRMSGVRLLITSRTIFLVSLKPFSTTYPASPTPRRRTYRAQRG
jgi:hypothetical protein